MKQIPENATPYKKTAVFTEETIPQSLRQQHNTKEGVWGKIWVVSGTLRYRILSPAQEEFILTPANAGVVEPEVPHQVEPLGRVEFYVEFYR